MGDAGPRIVDLSAPIVHAPGPLGVEVELRDHAAGARDIEQILGVPARLLRDAEGWATDVLNGFGTHNTTHVDAPWHYNSVIRGERAATIDELPLDWFLRPGVVLDFTAKADGNAVTASEVEAELTRVGHALQPLDIVLVRTGRDAYLREPDYMIRGPGVTPEATRWLWDRGTRVVGIDCWGWDAPLHLQAERAKAEDRGGIFWAAHQADLPYCQIERLVNLGGVPATGFTVACFPLKVAGGSAGPARVVAIL
jgi:kynurenine formamidase